MRTNKLALLAVLLVLVLAPAAAFAALTVGPVVPYNATAHTGNGFPLFYTDATGLGVTLPVPVYGDGGLGGVIPTMIFFPPTKPPLNQFSKDIGFDTEAFYFYIQPDRTTFDNVIDPVGKGGAVNIVLGLEAGFASLSPPFPYAGAPEDGQQSTFERIQFKWKASMTQVVPDGVYKFFHPWGVEVMTVATGGAGFTYRNQTFVAPGNFTSAASGPITSFLTQTPPLTIQATTPPPYNNPAIWIGDGSTPATFTGSPPNTNGSAAGYNLFRLEAYLADGTTANPIFKDPNPPFGNVNWVQTNKAVISGVKYIRPKGKITGPLDLLLLDTP